MRARGIGSGVAWGGSAVPVLAGLDGGFVDRVETSPFVAVLLVLLIIFMVLTPSTTGDWFAPRAATASVMPNGRVRLAVTRDGQVWLRVRDETRRVDAVGIVPALREGLASSPDPESVYVMAEDQTPYPTVLRVLEAAREAGARRVGFLATRPRVSRRIRLTRPEPHQG